MGNNTFTRHVLFLFCISYAFSMSVYCQTDIKYEKLTDGVEHWYRIKPTDEKPWFFQQLENLFDVVLSQRDKLPFGRSVAFLVGVSDYKYLSPDLPFVKNDLHDMRQFLLTKGGFDEVYVASENIVNRDLIEDYIRNKFPRWLKQEDRLLFYYSGHGDDAGGRTGYMQFSNARKNNFAG
ncbi:MAG: caspase family protein, partial [bacterium]